MPENHACVGYALALPPRQYTTTSESHTTYAMGWTTASVSKREFISFLVGAALVWFVGASMLLGLLAFSSYALIINSALFVLAFLGHEYAHKLAAARNGLWAEFRLNSFGVVLTGLSVILPIKFVAPGAVVLGGYGDRRTLGLVGAWGPAVNLAISTALLPIILLLGAWVLLPSYYINSFIATFNLIPLAILDGKKVYDWSPAVWVSMFVYSLAHVALAYLFL